MRAVKLSHFAAAGALAATAVLGALSAAQAQELVLGVIGNSKDMVQPYSPTSSASASSLYAQLYDNLTSYDLSGAVVMRLAESMTPNATLDVWTVKLRPNVKRHDGKPFTAADVIASVKYMMDKANNFIVSSQIDFVDPKSCARSMT